MGLIGQTTSGPNLTQFGLISRDRSPVADLGWVGRLGEAEARRH